VAETVIRLKPGKERPVQLGHPWIFAGAIEGLDAGIEAGSPVAVHTAEGAYCGRGYLNPRCAIAVRLLTHADEPLDAAFFAHRVAAAMELRRLVVPSDSDAYRVVNGEGDFLPGFVADRYGEVIVVQCLTAGAARLQPLFVGALRTVLEPRGVYERSAGAVRREEGLRPAEGVVAGAVPPEALRVRECGQQFWVDVRGGQKTGFFLDQRDNRVLARQLAAGRRVLNAFAYTGGFAVYAGAGGARQVVSVESSTRALELARRNWAANALEPHGAEFIAADVFTFLRTADALFDLAILDPPALVKRRQDLQRGARAYKDLHRWAFRRAAAGAFVMTFSCSQHMPLALFRTVVHRAAVEAGREVQVLRPLAAGSDHPVNLAHPEGEYLKGLLLRVGP
jgi:23S rRNA (cytosine1962-C5)-methyltransferase